MDNKREKGLFETMGIQFDGYLRSFYQLDQKICSICEAMNSKIDDLDSKVERLDSSIQKLKEETATNADAEKKLEKEKEKTERLGKDNTDLNNANKGLNADLERLKSELSERNEEYKDALSRQEIEFKDAFSKKETEYKEMLSRKEREWKEAEQEAIRAFREETGGLYEKYGDLYRNFIESPWAEEDTAMKCFYGSDYATFFALCSHEKTVEKFYKELKLAIGKKGKEYVQMADWLLDFCVDACSHISGMEYTRQNVQAGDEYNYNEHEPCGVNAGSHVSRVILRGIAKEDGTIMRSYVER